jgi:dihydrofolate synthase/folylpolyglutamate synthase
VNGAGKAQGAGIRTGVAWTPAQAEEYLRSLELFGMRFGLERTRRLMTALGSPQGRFDSIHVVGTNGKSSTTRMIAAILERHGLRTGAYLSPHLVSYTERVQVGERDISPAALAAAVQRAAHAAEHVNHTLDEDDRVTQFELLTAAGLWELARGGVEVAAIEAGLGGRYDATSVIEAPVCVLTNVDLEHTRWLGPTVRDIAAEKLAVVPDGATLVVGPDLPPEVRTLAREVARERGARLVEVPAPRMHRAHARPRARVMPPFQRRNFAVARAAAERYLEQRAIAPRAQAIAQGAAIVVPGRLEVARRAPLTIFDGAHNAAAARALAEALRELGAGQGCLGLVLGVLEDKDAVGMLRALLPLAARAWFTAPPGPRALPPAALLSLARQLGFEDAECEPRPGRALGEAWRWARDQGRASDEGQANPRRGRQSRGAGAEVLVTGSIYLIGELHRELAGAQRSVSTSTGR